MSANEILLKKLFNRSIDTKNDEIDELVAGLLCSLIKRDSTIIDACTDLIISNTKSKDVTYAIKTLELLQECMLKSSPEFREVVSKYKFLNQLFTLVSTNHEGQQTPQEVRNKIMDILLLWTTQYPKEKKIKDVYTRLCMEGIQHGPTLNLTSDNRMSFLNVQQEKTLKELLQSKDKADIYKANLLIRFFVEQDNKKKNRKVQATSRIQEIEGVVDELNDFINNCIEKGNEKDKETLCIMKEFYDTVSECKEELPLLIETLDECEEDLLAQVIEINDKCIDVINRYNTEILPSIKTVQDLDKEEKNEDVLSDFLGASNANVSLPKDQMQELEEIFIKTPDNPPINASNFTLLEPIQIVNEEPEPNIDDLLNLTSSKSSLLKDIDEISENLLKSKIPDGKITGKFKRPPKKLSLNELAKSKSEPKDDKDYVEQCANVSLMDTLTNTTATCEESSNSLLTEEAPSANIEASITTTISDYNIEEIRKSPDLKTEEQKKPENSPQQSTIKSLSEICLDVDQVQPSKIKPKTIFNNEELQIIFNFAANKPYPGVSVIVISTINRSNLPLGNYQFDASAGKRYKLRLLPPTDHSLPATEPFKLPTIAIQQILLLYNPAGNPVDITCIVGYTLGDDQDVIKESIFVKDLPNCV